MPKKKCNQRRTNKSPSTLKSAIVMRSSPFRRLRFHLIYHALISIGNECVYYGGMRAFRTLRHTGFWITAAFMTAGFCRAVPAWAANIRPDIFDATGAFADGVQIQAFEASRRLRAARQNSFNSIKRNDDELSHPDEVLPFAWIIGLDYFRSTLPPQSNGTLTDESVAFKGGVDWQVSDGADVGALLAIDTIPGENYNQGIMKAWFHALVP